MALTGIKDTDFLILDLLDDSELGNVCQTNKKASFLCNDENFWLRRTQSRFGKYLLPLGIDVRNYNNGSWKDYYIKLKNVVKETLNHWKIVAIPYTYYSIKKFEALYSFSWENLKKFNFDLYVGYGMYDERRKNRKNGDEILLLGEDEKALAVQTIIANNNENYKDISNIPWDNYLFHPRSVSVTRDILKMRNLAKIDSVRKIFNKLNPNELILYHVDFFKSKRIPFLLLILENKNLTKKGLIDALNKYKLSKEAKPYVIEKLKQLGFSRKDVKLIYSTVNYDKIRKQFK
jgi:hypothetical protein